MMNRWGVRLTRGFNWKEMVRCIKNPFLKSDKKHNFCWGRVLVWYIDFDREKCKKGY